MNATKSAKGDVEVAVALELLAEYTEKLRTWREWRERITPPPSSKTSADAKLFIRNHISLFEDLDRNVSQSIEFKAHHPLDKINLILKLHEFEGELESARRFASQ